MQILSTLLSYAQKDEIECVLIGGHAANFYGISRQTGDLDLVVSRDDKKFWNDLLLNLHYERSQYDDRFARYRNSNLAMWPIDLMFVDPSTFQKMITEAIKGKIGNCEMKVISPKHLLTLKLHALKIDQPHREPKDYGDALALIKTGRVGIQKDELKALCDRYSRPEIYMRLLQDLGWI